MPDRFRFVTAALLADLTAIVGAERVATDPERLAKQSKDFYWYSPVLRRLLDDKVGEAVVAPENLEQLKAVVGLLARSNVPHLMRGGATGNYGQCVPLQGGVVVDLTSLDRFEITADGVVRAEPGARLGAIEPAARAAGWELRCLPSTWVKSTLGGFLCGGSGGIGSITWGGITSGDNVPSVTILSSEPEPRLERLEGAAALTALHTYGTTGTLVEIEMRLGPAVPYEELIFEHPEWDALLDWTDAAARETAWRKRLVTLFEAGITDYFKPLRKHLGETSAATAFLMVDTAQAEEVIVSAAAVGATCVYRRLLPEPIKPPYITDYTWNHTTLWAIKSDPAITYLQSGFTADFRAQIQALWKRFPGEIRFHLEWTAGNAKLATHSQRMATGSRVVVGGIPLVHFKSEARLLEIIDACTELGVYTANPHTYVLEEGGTHPDIEAKRALKAAMDPRGLLNPGKMATFRPHPFISA